MNTKTRRHKVNMLHLLRSGLSKQLEVSQVAWQLSLVAPTSSCFCYVVTTQLGYMCMFSQDKVLLLPLLDTLPAEPKGAWIDSGMSDHGLSKAYSPPPSVGRIWQPALAHRKTRRSSWMMDLLHLSVVAVDSLLSSVFVLVLSCCVCSYSCCSTVCRFWCCCLPSRNCSSFFGYRHFPFMSFMMMMSPTGGLRLSSQSSDAPSQCML